MSAPQPFYLSRDAAMRQSFFDGVAAAASATSSASVAPPSPLPPPPPGHSGRQNPSSAGNSSGGRNGNRPNNSASRDKASGNNVGGVGSKPSPEETHDTAALLHLHLQLSQHLQRGQQMVTDADIIRALKRLALNNSGTPDPPAAPLYATRSEQQHSRGKSTGSNYSSFSGGRNGQSYGRCSNDRSTLASLREANAGNDAIRGSAERVSTGSLSQDGAPPALPVAGSSSRASVSDTNGNGAVYGTSSCTSEDVGRPPAPLGSQQIRCVQNGACGGITSRGKHPQHNSQAWRCRMCGDFNLGQPAGRCLSCGKLQHPGRHSASNNAAGKRSQHGRKQSHQHGSIQQQNLHLQQLQRDVLLAAVSAAAAATEKRADDNKVKRAAAAAAAVIAAESQQHASGRKNGSPPRCSSYLTQNAGENVLAASHNVGKELFGGVHNLTAASGGALPPESDSSFELFLAENFLRQQHHGHIGSGRLLTEDGYEDSTAAAAAAAAAAATLFPGLLQTLESCSSASTLLAKERPSSTLHEGASERVQQQLLTRGGGDITNGAASTSHTTPVGLSSDLLEGFSSLDSDEMGRVANCLEEDAGPPGASVSTSNVDSNGSRETATTGSGAGNGLSAGCSNAADAAASSSSVQASPSFSDAILTGAATDACIRANSARSRLIGASGQYQGKGDCVLSNAQGLAIGKGSPTIPGFAGEECAATPFSAATLLSEAETPFEGSGSTTRMDIMAFQDFASAPQSTLLGDVLTPGIASFNLLGDSRSLSSGTSSSPLTRSGSNTFGSARGHLTCSTDPCRDGGARETVRGASVERESSRMNCSRDQNADTLRAGVMDGDGLANRTSTSILNNGGGRVARGGRRDIYLSNEHSQYHGFRGHKVTTGRSNHASSSSSSPQAHLYPRTPGRHSHHGNVAHPHAVASAARAQPFPHDSLEQHLLNRAPDSKDSPQRGDSSDYSVTRSSLPLSLAASSPSAGIGGLEEYSPLAVNGGAIGGPVCTNLGRLPGAGGMAMDPASLRALLPTFLSPVQMLLFEAKEVADRLVEEFTALGYGDPISRAADALRTSLSILGFPTTPDSGSADNRLAATCERACSNGIANGDRLKAGSGAPAGLQNTPTGDNNAVTGCVGEDSSKKTKNTSWVQGVGGPHFSAPAMLAHPDEFKNPSSFLKIYGDPMCAVAEATSASPQAGLFVPNARGATRSGPGGVTGRSGEGFSGGSNLPIKGHNGNWVCDTCSNINFPRRFRCNKCGGIRGPQGDAIVAEYAKLVYHQHLKTYRNLASRPGVDLPLKRLQGSAGGGAGGNGSCGGGGSAGIKKNCSSSYCSPSSIGGSTTTNSITGSTPSTPSETPNMAAVQGTTVSPGGFQRSSTGTTIRYRIVDGIHQAGTDGGRAPSGTLTSIETFSSGGVGNAVSHPNQNAKGQLTLETPSTMPRHTQAMTRGQVGSPVSCFPPPPSTEEIVRPGPPRYQREIGCDDNIAIRAITDYVGSSPRATRGSATKISRAAHASLTGMLADSCSPQGYKCTSSCSSRERQRGLRIATSTRSAAKATQASLESDSMTKPDSTVYSPNCSPTSCRPSGPDGEKHSSSARLNTKSVLSNMTEKAYGNEIATLCCNEPPTKVEAEEGNPAAPQPPAVPPTPPDTCLSSANKEADKMPTLACRTTAAGSSSDGISGSVPDVTSNQNMPQ